MRQSRPRAPATTAAALRLSPTKFAHWPRLPKKAHETCKVLPRKSKPKSVRWRLSSRRAADTATAEAQKSQTVILALGELRKEVGALAEGSQSIAVATLEAESAAREAQKGAEIISSAAEEQAAAAAEALRSVEQQASVLDESQAASRSLSVLATDLKSVDQQVMPARISSLPPLSSSLPPFRKCRVRRRRS